MTFPWYTRAAGWILDALFKLRLKLFGREP